ncbi:toxin Cry1Ac domain D-VI-related protein [Bacillus swezeyi]|uniref:toxin Cry1Ac domain D-VI-related protein n=1 Tax=Bacillus swezeyi TaxID=1925020 RepID=UPI002E23BEEB|nr:toxin Cry1Ac domain D-VI-related protein [Bacillus swezeyi]
MKKKLIVGVLAGAIVLGGGGTVFHTYQAHAEEQRNLQNATEAVNSLYSSSKQDSLSDSVSEDRIKKAKSLLEKVNDKDQQLDLSKKVSNAYVMFKASKLVTDDIPDGVIINDLTRDELDVTKGYVEKVKPISGKLYKELSKKLSEAYAQVKQIAETDKLFDELSNKDDWTSYKKLEKAVSKVSNKDAKKEFQKTLKKIKNRIEEKEKHHKKIDQQLKEIEDSHQGDNSASGGSTKAETSSSTSGNSDASSSLKQNSSSVPKSKSSSSSSNISSDKRSTTSASSSKHQSSSSAKTKQESKQNNNKRSSSSKSSSGSDSSSKSSPGSSGTDWDKVGKDLENKDWSKTGSGEIDKGGNTWDSWK